ncbi:unnamed protein product [marine sediment metagenome]|uniref:Nucleotidyltransferase n=1 Tax=marine sediment metagenome TaxID=412755 RepID=X0RHS3_9ZZZZ
MDDRIKEYNIIALIRFGSHLYGTNTENSDTDYKGIFLPSREMIFLGKIPKSVRLDSKTDNNSKNTNADIDCELYSLHYFIELACKGETVALDMLHVDNKNLLTTSETWDNITQNRSLFLTKNLKSFVGYARRQAAKYGVKGSRLNAAREFVEVITKEAADEERGLDIRMKDIWGKLPLNEHCRFIEDSPNGTGQYQICGKILQSSITVDMAHGIISGFIDVYGDRARQAADNKGIDWKAMSHALRAAYQTREILTTGKIQYPLQDAAFLRDVKTGKLDFLSVVLPMLETEMAEVERLSEISTLPEKVDRKYWDDFIIESIGTVSIIE